MPILSLLAKLGLDKTGFDAGMTAAGKQVSKFGAGLKSQLAGAFAAGAMIAFAKSVIDTASEIKDLSDRLGVSGQDIQEFGMAAKLGGQDVEAFAKALEKIRLASAKGDNPLAMFGVTAEQMRAGVPALRQLAEGMKDFTGSPEQTRALADVFGAKGMGSVVNMLRELGGKTLGQMLFSQEDIERADKLGDSLTIIANNLKVLAIKFASGFFDFFAPAFNFGVPLPKAKTPTSPDIGKGGPSEDELAAAKQLADVEAKTAEQIERNRIAQMTEEERLNELYAQRLELVRQLAFALTNEAQAGVQLKIAQNAGDIIAAQKKANKTDKAGALGATIAESSLGRIGVFTGAASNASLSANQARVVQELQKMNGLLSQKGIVVKDARQ